MLRHPMIIAGQSLLLQLITLFLDFPTTDNRRLTINQKGWPVMETNNIFDLEELEEFEELTRYSF